MLDNPYPDSDMSVDENNTIIDAKSPTTHSKDEFLFVVPPFPLLSSPSASTSSSSVYTSSNSNSSVSSHSINFRNSIKKTPKGKKLTNYIDIVSQKEQEQITESLTNLIFGCSLPLRIVESQHFRNFIKQIRPGFYEKIPNRKTLSTTLLDQAYDKVITKSIRTIRNDSTILIDGWKNSSNNTKTIVCMLHNADGGQAFLNAWDVSSESETAEKLADIIYEAIDISKNLYNTNTYAVVSDNASVMMKMGRLVAHTVWHTTCNSHTANLLAKDIVDKILTDNVVLILKEFKQTHLEKALVSRGGKRIKLPCDTRWCSYQNAYKSLINNLQHMRMIVADMTSTNRHVKSSISKLLFDENFIQNVKENIEFFNPVCVLINKCQEKNCSLADATGMWLNLKIPEKFEYKYGECFNMRKKMALNIYALAAYYIHPYYDNSKLSKSDLDEINNFLFKNLNCEGIEDWDAFKNRGKFFKDLFEKGKMDPLVFWNMADMKHPNLAKLAKKLLLIPASTAQIERVFSSWAFVHTSARNRLTFDRSKKLLHIYYSLRIEDKVIDSSSEDEE